MAQPLPPLAGYNVVYRADTGNYAYQKITNNSYTQQAQQGGIETPQSAGRSYGWDQTQLQRGSAKEAAAMKNEEAAGENIYGVQQEYGGLKQFGSTLHQPINPNAKSGNVSHEVNRTANEPNKTDYSKLQVNENTVKDAISRQQAARQENIAQETYFKNLSNPNLSAYHQANIMKNPIIIQPQRTASNQQQAEDQYDNLLYKQPTKQTTQEPEQEKSFEQVQQERIAKVNKFNEQNNQKLTQEQVNEIASNAFGTFNFIKQFQQQKAIEQENANITYLNAMGVLKAIKEYQAQPKPVSYEQSIKSLVGGVNEKWTIEDNPILSFTSGANDFLKNMAVTTATAIESIPLAVTGNVKEILAGTPPPLIKTDLGNFPYSPEAIKFNAENAPPTIIDTVLGKEISSKPLSYNLGQAAGLIALSVLTLKGPVEGLISKIPKPTPANADLVTAYAKSEGLIKPPEIQNPIINKNLGPGLKQEPIITGYKPTNFRDFNEVNGIKPSKYNILENGVETGEPISPKPATVAAKQTFFTPIGTIERNPEIIKALSKPIEATPNTLKVAQESLLTPNKIKSQPIPQGDLLSPDVSAKPPGKGPADIQKLFSKNEPRQVPYSGSNPPIQKNYPFEINPEPKIDLNKYQEIGYIPKQKVISKPEARIKDLFGPDVSAKPSGKGPADIQNLFSKNEPRQVPSIGKAPFSKNYPIEPQTEIPIGLINYEKIGYIPKSESPLLTTKARLTELGQRQEALSLLKQGINAKRNPIYYSRQGTPIKLMGKFSKDIAKQTLGKRPKLEFELTDSEKEKLLSKVNPEYNPASNYKPKLGGYKGLGQGPKDIQFEDLTKTIEHEKTSNLLSPEEQAINERYPLMKSGNYKPNNPFESTPRQVPYSGSKPPIQTKHPFDIITESVKIDYEKIGYIPKAIEKPTILKPGQNELDLGYSPKREIPKTGGGKGKINIKYGEIFTENEQPNNFRYTKRETPDIFSKEQSNKLEKHFEEINIKKESNIYTEFVRNQRKLFKSTNINLGKGLGSFTGGKSDLSHFTGKPKPPGTPNNKPFTGKTTFKEIPTNTKQVLVQQVKQEVKPKLEQKAKFKEYPIQLGQGKTGLVPIKPKPIINKAEELNNKYLEILSKNRKKNEEKLFVSAFTSAEQIVSTSLKTMPANMIFKEKVTFEQKQTALTGIKALQKNVQDVLQVQQQKQSYQQIFKQTQKQSSKQEQIYTQTSKQIEKQGQKQGQTQPQIFKTGGISILKIPNPEPQKTGQTQITIPNPHTPPPPTPTKNPPPPPFPLLPPVTPKTKIKKFKKKQVNFLGNTQVSSVYGLYARNEVIYGNKKTAKLVSKDIRKASSGSFENNPLISKQTKEQYKPYINKINRYSRTKINAKPFSYKTKIKSKSKAPKF